jgi:hypothetical protein
LIFKILTHLCTKITQTPHGILPTGFDRAKGKIKKNAFAARFRLRLSMVKVS